jgi:hypothetical protein
MHIVENLEIKGLRIWKLGSKPEKRLHFNKKLGTEIRGAIRFLKKSQIRKQRLTSKVGITKTMVET